MSETRCEIPWCARSVLAASMFLSVLIPAVMAAALKPAAGLPPAELYRSLNNVGMFGGDVVNSISLFRSFQNDPDPMKHYTYWTHGIIPFTVDESINGAMDLIHEAMDEIEKKTCVRFQRLKSDHGVKNFVHFTATNPLGGCWSSVGMDTRRSQVMNLQKPECWDKGVILHELVHNIGFYHEHQRPDRDNYIDVLYRNVRPEPCGND
ncbi:unnamed protein product [Notodromas monacha]|uniref:Metalloendopeptidase n=1 Tax=Notodromas monacha TaxID=399045 RepID=A0A7R9GK40_9CRUS|nr:unnamed protein product [Notodromas monacha]CAG0924342.1 unnamed protein product [Notodromas monacha]